MSLSTLPANDTTPATLTVGQTFEAGVWRVQRWTGRVEVVNLENAGRRGKACSVFSVDTPYTTMEAQLDAVAHVAVAAARDGVHVETMRATFMAEAVEKLTFRASEKRGVDVPRHPEIKVDAPLVRCRFTEVEALCCFSFWLGKEGGMKHDELLAAVSRLDAAKAYQWAKDRQGEIASMSAASFRAAMSGIGARFR